MSEHRSEVAERSSIGNSDSATLPLVSAVIVAYGDDPWLERAVRSSLSSEGVQVEVVVVDNGCTGGVIDGLEDIEGLEVVRPGVNLGFAGGCNAGADRARGGVVVFLNQDVSLAPDALAALARVVLRPDVGIATASVRLADDPTHLNSAGNPVHFLGFSWAGACGEPASSHRVEEDVASASGAAMAVSRDVWGRLGGFAEEFFAYQEDTDISLRCWQLGLRVVYVPSAVVIHRYEISRNAEKYYLLERNRLLMVLTLYERRTLLLLLPAMLAVEAGTLLLAVSQGWGREKLAAWRWVVGNRALVRSRRAVVQDRRQAPDAEIAHRLVARFAAPTLAVPAWADPVDHLLAGYWRWVRRVISSGRK